jgi:hypothetical protein
MSLIRKNKKCPAEQLVISKTFPHHRYRMVRMFEADNGETHIHVEPLDAGFQDYATAQWPTSWVWLPANPNNAT